jgi:hypothetical protein
MDSGCDSLTKAIQCTIDSQVLTMNLTLRSKRWWTKELTQLHWETNKLGRQSYNRQHDLEHAIYEKHSVVAKNYCRILEQTKQQHWRDWLEKVEDPDI